MQIKDYVTIAISIIALLFSFVSLIFTFLNYKRNATKLRVEQLHFSPNPCRTTITPNKLFLDKKQSTDLWEVIPILHLVIYLKIDNLSHTGITLSNFILNDKFLVSKINTTELKEELSLSFFASKKCHDKELNEYGHSVPMATITLEPNDYTVIKVGDRIEPKSSIEGIIIISGNWNLYAAVTDGINKFTIVTPDKKFDKYIEIDKTVIPHFSITQ